MGMAFLLFAITLALFWPARGFDYIHLDDYPFVAANPMVMDGLTGAAVQRAFTTVREQCWLPLLWISYMGDVAVFGTGPQGHHLVNVLLHALNSALLFWALFRLTGSRWRSFFVAALFAWHPTRVEAVAWITARKDVLSGLFFMLALLAYARHAEKPSAGRLGLVFLLMLVGLLAKAILIILPPVLLLMDYWPLRRAERLWGREAWREWRPLLAEKAPLIALSAVFMVVSLWTHTSGSGRLDPVSLPERLGMIAPNYFAYLGIILVPIRLNVIYPESNLVSWPVTIAATLALAGMTLVLFRRRMKHPYGLVGGLWFLVALLPVVRGIRLGLAQYTDRFTYLPLIGLGMALAWGAVEWSHRPARKRIASVLGVLLLALCLVRTHAQLPRWKDSLTLLSRAVRLAPTSPTVHFGLGNALFEAGRLREAEVHWREAVRLHPGNEQARGNWGAVLVLLGRAEEAREILRPVLEGEREMSALIHGAYGMASLHLGDWPAALRHLGEALEVDPDNSGYRIERIRAFFESGADEQALAQVAQMREWPGGEIHSAADLFPFYLQRWRDGAQPYAWEYFRRTLAAHPDSVPFLNNVAWLAATDPEAPPGTVAGAVGFARRAVDLTGGDDPVAQNTLAAALAAAGDFGAAAVVAEKARALADAQGDSALAERIAGRLLLYRNGTACRE